MSVVVGLMYIKNVVGLLQKRQKAGSSFKLVVSLEAIGEYIAKCGYFTDFSDNGSGIWSFEVRKPFVHILTPQNSNSLNVGDEIEIRASIEHVASARLIVGRVYPMGYSVVLRPFLWHKITPLSVTVFISFTITTTV